MKLSAYMFIRNGIRGGYTFMEAIENVLPFVHEFFVLDGRSDDGTLEALRSLAAFDGRIRIESALPAYVSAPKDERGLLLGEAFENARRECDGDWLIQVQADTVFHPVTVLAVKDFLERNGRSWRCDAIEMVRRQYRWNWQEMYREDRLSLIFRKEAGRVDGDAINVNVDGRTSRRFLPLFEKFPAADNAWIFFGNLAGKRQGCREIWNMPGTHGKDGDFPWYDRATGRSFEADLTAYLEKGELPPFWRRKASPFGGSLPANLAALVGLAEYAVAGRFSRSGGVYNPSPEERSAMLASAGNLSAPPRERIEDALASAGFAPFFSGLRRLSRRLRRG